MPSAITADDIEQYRLVLRQATLILRDPRSPSGAKRRTTQSLLRALGELIDVIERYAQEQASAEADREMVP